MDKISHSTYNGLVKGVRMNFEELSIKYNEKNIIKPRLFMATS